MPLMEKAPIEPLSNTKFIKNIYFFLNNREQLCHNRFLLRILEIEKSICSYNGILTTAASQIQRDSPKETKTEDSDNKFEKDDDDMVENLLPDLQDGDINDFISFIKMDVAEIRVQFQFSEIRILIQKSKKVSSIRNQLKTVEPDFGFNLTVADWIKKEISPKVLVTIKSNSTENTIFEKLEFLKQLDELIGKKKTSINRFYNRIYS
ncbi:hypothetical protein BpHYR1_046026 [Brachionus plicatilis]|uniref:Uncharacterized protein n=1 Tax=Brachionus plicatilis TaxID=10195 RepID=A0A3M7PVK0_BRAPC|nr:hypothetical protein BpHYR1_046026 [Brachionus plicatilis]